MEYIDVIDENNNLTGKVVSKNEVHEKGLFYREVIGIIVNDKNEVLLQKRAASKKEHANKWEFCYGHVSAGEMPRTAMLRELEEESGLKLTNNKSCFVFYLLIFKNYRLFLHCSLRMLSNNLKHVHFQVLQI